MTKLPIQKILAITLITASAAGLSFAYTPAPAGGPTGNNTDAPFTVGSFFDVKNGDLGINDTFYATDNSYIKGNTAVLGQINGGLVSGGLNSTATIGQAPTITDAAVSGTFRSNTIQADSLVPKTGVTYQTVTTGKGNVYNKVCTDTTGKLSLCLAAAAVVTPPTPTITDYTKTIMGSSVGFSTKHAACLALTFGGQYGHKMNIPFPVSGDIIYSSPAGTTPVNGGNNWYGLFYPDTATGNVSHNYPYVAQLSSAGVVGLSNSVPLLASGLPDCSLIY
ncbi:MAG: hypothetical protein WCQ32_00400 [bacterium]